VVFAVLVVFWEGGMESSEPQRRVLASGSVNLDPGIAVLVHGDMILLYDATQGIEDIAGIQMIGR
jgi:hypothetical protein